MACVSASSPVLAVMCAGMSSISSGSISATYGAISPVPPALYLMWRAGSVITDQRVTSLPVPAVVGTVIRGGMRFLIGCGSAHSYSRIEPPFVTTTPIAFAVSIGLPPPRPIRPSQPSPR